MEKYNKYILIGVGVIALVSVGLYASAQSKKKQDEKMPERKPTIVDAASNLVDKIMGNPQTAEQRIAARRVKQSTRQAKLLKKGKITIDDLKKLQQV